MNNLNFFSFSEDDNDYEIDEEELIEDIEALISTLNIGGNLWTFFFLNVVRLWYLEQFGGKKTKFSLKWAAKVFVL